MQNPTQNEDTMRALGNSFLKIADEDIDLEHPDIDAALLVMFTSFVSYYFQKVYYTSPKQDFTVDDFLDSLKNDN